MTKLKLAAASLLLIGTAASASATELYDVNLYQAPIAGTYYAGAPANRVAVRTAPATARTAFARAGRVAASAPKSPIASMNW